MAQGIGNDEKLLKGSFVTALHRLDEHFTITGYSQRVSADYIRVVKHFCYWHAQYFAQREVDDLIIKEFLDHLPSCHCPVSGRGSYRLCHAAVYHFLSVLRDTGLASHACETVLVEDDVLQRFQEYLRQVRGITKSSAALYVRHLRPLLQSIHVEGAFAFHSLTAREVEGFVAKRATQCKPATVKLFCTSLRAFFRFLRLTGEIEIPLENAVPTVPNWSLSNIPKYLPEEQITAFLSSFDVNTLLGLRNKAMALLMATAGLRAGEVASLMFEDIDWRKSSIRVRNTKSRRIDHLPLATKTGETLATYLGRKPQTKTRHIFVSLTAPTGRPLTASAVGIAMRRAFKRCSPDKTAHGTHVLRHRLATRMLSKGATFKEIADVLRHRNIETTAIYAKVDLKSLINAALPWPEVTI